MLTISAWGTRSLSDCFDGGGQIIDGGAGDRAAGQDVLVVVDGGAHVIGEFPNNRRAARDGGEKSENLEPHKRKSSWDKIRRALARSMG